MNTESCEMVRVQDRELLYGDSGKPGMFFWNFSVREVDGVEHRCKTLWAIYPDGLSDDELAALHVADNAARDALAASIEAAKSES